MAGVGEDHCLQKQFGKEVYENLLNILFKSCKRVYNKLKAQLSRVLQDFQSMCKQVF